MTTGRILSALALALAIGALLAAGPAHACTLADEVTHVVARVESGDTLTLDDGSEVVLIGALPPIARDGEPWPPAEQSRRALEGLVAGKAVALAFSGRRMDRYGRRLAHVFLPALPDGAPRVWMQGRMIADGHARAYALPGNAACIEDLLASEREARTGRHGLWGSGVFQDLDLNDPRALSRIRDTFQIIEGRVTRLGRLRGQTALYMGAASGSDVTVLLPAPREGGHPTAGVHQLVGRSIRVRGWVGWRRGAEIALDDARLIEPLDVIAAPPAAPPVAPGASIPAMAP
jgi:micrococcal nuclease